MNRLAFVCCICSLAGVAMADDQALTRCRASTDPAARLACYDAIPLSTNRTPVAPAAAAPSSPPFGFEERRTDLAGPLSIESSIAGRFDGWQPRTQLKLTNGQVWEISDASQAVYAKENPRVRITRGVSGTFFIAIDGVAQTPRVRRLQ